MKKLIVILGLILLSIEIFGQKKHIEIKENKIKLVWFFILFLIICPGCQEAE